VGGAEKLERGMFAQGEGILKLEKGVTKEQVREQNSSPPVQRKLSSGVFNRVPER